MEKIEQFVKKDGTWFLSNMYPDEAPEMTVAASLQPKLIFYSNDASQSIKFTIDKPYGTVAEATGDWIDDPNNPDWLRKFNIKIDKILSMNAEISPDASKNTIKCQIGATEYYNAIYNSSKKLYVNSWDTFAISLSKHSHKISLLEITFIQSTGILKSCAILYMAMHSISSQILLNLLLRNNILSASLFQKSPDAILPVYSFQYLFSIFSAIWIR